MRKIPIITLWEVYQKNLIKHWNYVLRLEHFKGIPKKVICFNERELDNEVWEREIITLASTNEWCNDQNII